MKTPVIHWIAAAFLANTAFADVLTVGASPADHSQISAAIAAALDGDTILVDPGSYSDLTIDDKALTIAPRIPGTTYHVSHVLIQNLAPNTRTYLRGVVSGGTVTVRNCQGSVRLDDSVGWGGLRVMDSMDVALRTLTIPTGGATISDSQVGIFDSSFMGNPGPILFLDGGDGGPGLVRSGTGEVFLSDCSVTGGRGGDGAFGLSNGTGGNGGHAIISNGDVFVQSCTLQGGAGGFGGLASGGPGGLGSGFTAEPGVASSVDVPASILDSKPIVLTFRGQPGDMVEYAFSPFGQIISNGTDVGRLVMDAAMGSGFIPAGNIPANGELRVTMHMGDTPSQGSNVFMVQGRVSAPGGPVVLSAPDWIVVYDECSGVVPIGSGYCGPAATNSTGQAGKLNAYGSDCSNSNRVTLVASQLPANQLGIFLCSQGQGFVAHPGGSAGNLCLGGGMAIGRFNEPAQAQVSNQNHLALGYYMQLDLDLMRLPRPAPGYDVAMASQTWNFQAWYRDNGQNNFTDAVSIRFR